MKKILLIIVVSLIANFAIAQQNWNMLNYNGYITKAAFCNVNTGWAVGGAGIIFKTTNSGINWVQQYNPLPGEYLDIVSAISPDVCIVGGSYINYLLRTSNGGVNWYNVNNFGGNTFWSVDFINQNTGWLISDSIIYKSTNGGNYWNLISVQSSYIRSIKFIDESNGYMINYNTRKLYKTINGGVNWVMSNLPGTGVYKIDFINLNTGYCTGNTKLYRTTNSGTNWDSIYQHNQYWVQVKFVNNNTAFSINNNGNIYKTNNGGFNWVQTWSDNNYIGDRWIYCSDSNNIFYGTYYLRLNKSSNGGLNFTNVLSASFPNFQNIYSSYFINNSTGYFYSDNNIIKTTNSGENFSTIGITGASVGKMKFVNENTGYSVYSNIVKKTTNGGYNWVSTGSFADVSLVDNDFININTGWVVGLWMNNYAYYFDLFLAKTTNGGTNWNYYIGYQNQTLGTIESVHFVDQNTGWCKARDENGSVVYIMKTTNGGTNFVRILDNIGSTQGNEVLLNQSTGYVAVGNKINKTTNGGINRIQTTFANSSFRDIDFVNGVFGWACGIYGDVYKTTNEGNNWTKLNTGLNYEFKNIDFVNENTGFITGDMGLILKTTNGGSVFLSNISKEVPTGYTLGQNYPNPFNPMCNVQFTMCNAGNVKIVVYDIQGREVQTLVNEKLNAGTYEVKFDGSMLTSGVYFYRMVTHGFTETRKMLLIK